MNRLRYILLLSLLVCSMTAGAQTYEQVLRQNFWNVSQNITGIRQDTVSRSYAEAFGKYETGGFRDSWQPRQEWSAGAVTASIRHLERMSLKGSFSFTQTEDYDMCGSMFIRPGYYPVDILEFTPGRKTLQTYTFDGGISYDLTRTLRLGAMMDFESANMAKRKDLRHANWLLDMTISPGFMYHNGDWSVGANYIFRKTSETIEATQVGVSESSYYAFLDKGLMYGIYNIWTGSGLHLEEAGLKGFPVKELDNGLAIQVQYRGFFAEAEYSHTSGTIGEKEYIWFLFPGNSVGLRLGYKHESEGAQHYARLNFGWENRTMDETVLEKVMEGGISTVIRHGQNQIQSENGWRLIPEYEYVTRKLEVLAKAQVGVKEELATQMYPYMNWQSLVTYGADARMKCYLGQIVLTGQIGYRAGKVKENAWLSGTQTGVQTNPYRLQEYYDWQTEYATISRVNAGLSLRWNFWKGLYAEADGRLTYAFSPKHITGNSRIGTSIAIGYNF